MSAKAAADALVAYDATLGKQIADLYDGHKHHSTVPKSDKAQLVRDVAGTWTLSLAASAAGVSEQQALVALARHHLHCGTPLAAEGFVCAALENRI